MEALKKEKFTIMQWDHASKCEESKVPSETIPTSSSLLFTQKTSINNTYNLNMADNLNFYFLSILKFDSAFVASIHLVIHTYKHSYSTGN